MLFQNTSGPNLNQMAVFVVPSAVTVMVHGQSPLIMF